MVEPVAGAGGGIVTIEVMAPAKLNLTLEVLGPRPDGYHEIVSVMQTIDLCDRVRIEPAEGLTLDVEGEAVLGVPLEGPRNLAFKAAQLLADEIGRPELGARIVLEKRVPAGMGLGGGSGDAAATLRGLVRLWEADLSTEALESVAAKVGSDVPFFLYGGAALAKGRGEQVEPLPDPAPRAFTLFVSDIETEDKTRRAYGCLTPSDYSDGHQTKVTAETLRRGLPLTEVDIKNAFDRHVGELAPPMLSAMHVCKGAGIAVFACGSGPGFFSLTPINELPALLLHEIEREWDVRAMACSSLSREEALRLVES